MPSPRRNKIIPIDEKAQFNAPALRSTLMADEAERFRRRARECRQAADRTPDGPWQAHLRILAEELDAEVARIERESGGHA